MSENEQRLWDVDTANRLLVAYRKQRRELEALLLEFLRLTSPTAWSEDNRKIGDLENLRGRAAEALDEGLGAAGESPA